MIFLLRPEFPIVADGVRSTNPVYQKEMDSRIVEALSKFSAQSKVVSLTGSVFERLNQITQSIGKYITKCEEVHGLGLGYAEFLRGIYGYKTASAHGVDF
jgi:nicotinamide riboside kinase